VLGANDASLYAVFASALLGLLWSWCLVLLLRRLQVTRPGFAIGTALAIAFAARLAAASVLSLSRSLADLRGPDERNFVLDAVNVAHAPFLGGEWTNGIPGDLHVRLFALQLRFLHADTPFPLRMTQIALAVAAIALLAAAAHDLAGRTAALVVAWIAALEPANVFFSGVLHKEGLMMLSEGLVVLGAVRMWQRRDRQAGCLLAAGVGIGLLTRPYAGAFLLVAAGLVTLHSALRQLGKDKQRATGLLVVVAIAAALGLGLVVSESNRLLDHLQRSQTANAMDYSNLRLAPVDFSSPGAVILHAPRRVLDLWSRPYPWEIANWSQRLGVLGTLTAWLLLFLVVAGLVKGGREAVRRAPPLIYVVICVTVGYALTTGNAGTGFRYRTHVLLLTATLAAVLVSDWMRGHGWTRVRLPRIRRPVVARP
jgi:hypothetical protein